MADYKDLIIWHLSAIISVGLLVSTHNSIKKDKEIISSLKSQISQLEWKINNPFCEKTENALMCYPLISKDIDGDGKDEYCSKNPLNSEYIHPTFSGNSK